MPQRDHERMFAFLRCADYAPPVDWLPVISVLIAGAALSLSAASALFARGQLQLARRLRDRDFEASVVVELISVRRINRRPRTPPADYPLGYQLRVTNAGPAVARAVDVHLTLWTDDSALGRIVDRADVAPALLRGEQRIVELVLTPDEALFEDRSRSLEIHGAYYDDNGVRYERLAFVFENSLVLTPPQPPA